jgi:hypothetical protein
MVGPHGRRDVRESRPNGRDIFSVLPCTMRGIVASHDLNTYAMAYVPVRLSAI